MRHRWMALVGALTLLTALAVPASAETQLGARNGPVSVKDSAAKITASAPDPDALIEVFVQLDVPSVGQFVAGEEDAGRTPSGNERRSQADKVDRQQRGVRAELQKLGAQEKFSLDYGANGIAVKVKARDLLTIAGLAGVKSVAPVVKHTPSNETSVPWIGAPELWSSSGDGTGVSIAVIDTGIDYLHADFGGSGDPLAYAANDPTVIEPGTFPTAKVVGGYDFVGDAYDASSSDPVVNTPNPDPDPLDCQGHGSHVSGTAAGEGVTDLIGPGVAPGASLYALKVFGCDGSTDVTSQAIEWAMNPDGDPATDDHVDVINMSLGSDFGDPNDPSAIATQTAVDLGIIVVASAGNDGNTVPYVTGSPAVAEGAISVAANYDGGYGTGAIQVNTPAGLAGLYEAQEGDIGPLLSVAGPLTGDVVVALSDGSVGDPTHGCTPFVNAADVAGKIALVQRGTCAFADKAANADAAGALAMIVYNDAARGDALLTMGGAKAGIPSTFIGHTAGAALAAATATDTVNVTLDASIEIPHPELADTIVPFSSRGPGGGGTTFKPDVSAPGANIRSVAVGTGDKYQVLSGTSMASPHVAGVAALLRQKYPDLDVEAIKSLIMNSAIPSPGGEPITVQGVGAVRANAAAALSAYASPAGVSFGRITPQEDRTYQQRVWVTNLTGSTMTYSIAVDEVESLPGVSIKVPDSIEVRGNRTASFLIKMKLDPKNMPADDGFFSETDVDGRIVLTSGDETLSIGYMASVDPAARVDAKISNRRGSSILKLTNASKTEGLVEMFTAVASGVGSLDTVGVRTDTTAGIVQFGVASENDWESLSARETDIYLDTDQDGVPEYALVAADLGYLTTGAASGVVVSALFDLVNGGVLLEYYVDADYNDTVQTLTVDRNGTYGFLADGDNTFDFTVLTYDNRFGLDGVAEGTVDLANDADDETNLGGTLAAGDQINLDVTPNGAREMLLTYANNDAGRQSEVLWLEPRPVRRGSRGGFHS